MQCVYQADNSLEAHMIKHLLDHHDLQSTLLGEHLQGGVGELQAMSMIRVMVDESDAAQATHIVSDWDAEQVTAESTYSLSERRLNWSDVFFGFVLGVLAMILVHYFYP